MKRYYPEGERPSSVVNERIAMLKGFQAVGINIWQFISLRMLREKIRRAKASNEGKYSDDLK